MRPTDADAPSELTLRGGGYAATVVALGGGLRTLAHGDRPLLDGFAAHEWPAGARGQVLIPWPNRIDGGRYAFDGEPHQLPVDPARGVAIHGLVRTARWTLAAHAPDRATASHRLPPQPGYPFELELHVTYRLDDGGLTVETAATNVGARRAPYGAGFHPYLAAGTDATIDRCELALPAAAWMPADERGIPLGTEPIGERLDFRRARPIGELALDHTFAALARDDRGRATVTLAAEGARTLLWMDETFAWCQVFSGDTLAQRRRGGLAVEPMTCPPNGFATGAGVIALEPGETHVSRWGIAAG